MKSLNKLIELIKKPNYILILAWVLPIGILLTILYLNFLPFGYEKTLTINVGSKSDDKGEFRLEQSQFLGSRQELDGKKFRYLDGLAYAVYEPKVVLRNATIEASLEADDGVSFILPPDLSQVKWDYDWNAENIAKDFQVQTSEANVFKILSSIPGQPISRSAKINPENGFTLQVNWTAGKSVLLLYGDIYLYQNQKNLVLKYAGQTLVYPLPDYFLGAERTAMIGFDGENLYLTTDKGQASQVSQITVSPKSPLSRGVVSNSSPYQREVGRGLPQDIKDSSPYQGEVGRGLPLITVSKGFAAQSLQLGLGMPSLVQTKGGCIYLDGDTRLIMPNTADKFEDGPFTVYAEWTPEKTANGQQIIGHYNWEIWQNENTISFNVGRMSSSTGLMYKISYNIDENFFNKPHALLAVYSPVSTSSFVILNEAKRSEGSDTSTSTAVTNGYIEFFVDGVFAGREHFANEAIWKDYNGNKSLGIGHTDHNSGDNPYFHGNILTVKFSQDIFNAITKNRQTFIIGGDKIQFSIYGTGEFTKFKIRIKK